LKGPHPPQAGDEIEVELTRGAEYLQPVNFGIKI
jgi:hypothetical protein